MRYAHSFSKESKQQQKYQKLRYWDVLRAYLPAPLSLSAVSRTIFQFVSILANNSLSLATKNIPFDFYQILFACNNNANINELFYSPRILTHINAERNRKRRDVWRDSHILLSRMLWISFHFLLSCYDCFELFSVSDTKETCSIRNICRRIQWLWDYFRVPTHYWIFIVNDIWECSLYVELQWKLERGSNSIGIYT